MAANLGDRIVYEDNHILVLNKLPSEIVQGDKTGDEPLSELVKAFIKKRDAKPGNVFCGVVHRLDRPVSGLVLFAKTSKGLSRFNELIRDRAIEKKYLAVVESRPDKQKGLLTDYLIKNEATNTSRVVKEGTPGALKAELGYEVLDASDRYHLLKIDLLTGRHHQIRCQLAAKGWNVKGDLKYGAKRSNKGPYIHLHAFELAFLHPVKQERVHLTAWPAFEDPLWKYFSDRVKL
jgi:23S rRNA pseudouridine1911/1915/1917 synthase